MQKYYFLQNDKMFFQNALPTCETIRKKDECAIKRIVFLCNFAISFKKK